MARKYVADINNIIALCHIVDDFEEFRQKLIPMISPKYNRNFIFQLWEILEGKTKLGARKAKKFYTENKSVIDTINQYTQITRFINLNYGYYGDCTGSLEFFYEYILEHKNEINQILNILEKLKELDFHTFEFEEDINFTTETHCLLPPLRANYSIIYLDNIEVSPGYSTEVIYRSTSSNYKMNLGVSGESFSKYGKSITLNSLLFDPKRLPKKIDEKEIFDSILTLKHKQESTSEAIRNSVDLSVGVSDLEYQFNSTSSIISSLNGVENKVELLQVLFDIKADIDKLKTLSEEYDKSVATNHPSITSEILEHEKNLYLRKRTQ